MLTVAAEDSCPAPPGIRGIMVVTTKTVGA
jgi:hypothetical protein